MSRMWRAAEAGQMPYGVQVMPAKSEAQRRLMAAAAHKKGGVKGVPQKVGKEFMKADPGGKLPKHAKGRK